MRLSVLSIVSCLGVILSAGAVVYTATGYLALSRSTKALDVLASTEDVMAPKIASMLAKHQAKSLIAGELKARHEQNASLHATLTRMTIESQRRARNETVLWAGAGLFFFVLLVRAEHLRRREKAQNL